MTPYGKAIRHLRIDHAMLLGEMAEALAMSPSYLSQIETGKKAIPSDMTGKVVRMFGLDATAIEALRSAEALSVSEFKIRLDSSASDQDKFIANEFAHEFARLTPEAKTRIQSIVRGEDK
ncbi:helix-turn-helix domain-containing protein [Sphingomonas sp. Leaf10]|uniref:helix-turn-helix domain-containing protein n=1 Tax=Sphingomonas sp. Leaf10 TaxID=1735676 RepID=UPI0006F59C33|nr:helix-turn-helix transcriptional regulator [Sphingomonas sp. Leaf10]KQM36056.1 hypothetical protein ASE59_15425 [Sphingomonas sp. Leaf10]